MHEPDADDQMRAHFDQRAAEYDGWWLGTGSHAERERPGWSAEVEELIGVVQSLPPARVLDVACGTGFLTQHLRGDWWRSTRALGWSRLLRHGCRTLA